MRHILTTSSLFSSAISAPAEFTDADLNATRFTRDAPFSFAAQPSEIEEETSEVEGSPIQEKLHHDSSSEPQHPDAGVVSRLVVPSQPRYLALYDFNKTDEDEVSFKVLCIAAVVCIS